MDKAMKRSKTLLGLAAAATLAACGNDSEAPEAPDTDATAAAEPAPDPNNPFAQAETEMNQRMMQAVGADVSDTWVKQMIEHHRGAIEMSEIMLAQNPSEHVRGMTEDGIRKQTAEIEKLNRLVSGSPADPASAEPYHAVHQEMSQAMRAATGENVEQTFMRKMLAHHRGGVALSDVVLARRENPRVRQQAQETRRGQENEAKMVEDMLAGRPMTNPSAAPSPAPTASAAPVARTTPAARASAPPAPARAPAAPRATASPSPAASAAADPHSGHDMSESE